MEVFFFLRMDKSNRIVNVACRVRLEFIAPVFAYLELVIFTFEIVG